MTDRGVILALDELHLDPTNPRLPEEVQDGSEEAILRYVRENGELTELARSFADNGYFVQEPVLVVQRQQGGYKVVEGNRRVATLKLLLANGSPPFIDVELTEAGYRPSSWRARKTCIGTSGSATSPACSRGARRPRPVTCIQKSKRRPRALEIRSAPSDAV
jgi:hypothetical protein